VCHTHSFPRILQPNHSRQLGLKALLFLCFLIFHRRRSKANTLNKHFRVCCTLGEKSHSQLISKTLHLTSRKYSNYGWLTKLRQALTKVVKGLWIIMATGPIQRLPVMKLYLIPEEQSAVASSFQGTSQIDKAVKSPSNIMASQFVQQLPHAMRPIKTDSAAQNPS
jgi:hypothetical protein